MSLEPVCIPSQTKQKKTKKDEEELQGNTGVRKTKLLSLGDLFCFWLL